jgi:hypothetical protein
MGFFGLDGLTTRIAHTCPMPMGHGTTGLPIRLWNPWTLAFSRPLAGGFASAPPAIRPNALRAG